MQKKKKVYSKYYYAWCLQWQIYAKCSCQVSKYIHVQVIHLRIVREPEQILQKKDWKVQWKAGQNGQGTGWFAMDNELDIFGVPTSAQEYAYTWRLSCRHLLQQVDYNFYFVNTGILLFRDDLGHEHYCYEEIYLPSLT